jgi:hypothetical protein
VKLSVEASRSALAEWGGDPADLTHIVAVTCTNSANPGFDHYVVKQLGLNTSMEKVLLHGVGCSGGLAALRTAANLAHGASFRGKSARILVLACEITSLLVRSELDSIAELQETRIGVTLFSDCASAVVLGNELGKSLVEEPLLELLGWDHRILDDTENDLGFDVDPSGIYTSLPFFWVLSWSFLRLSCHHLSIQPTIAKMNADWYRLEGHPLSSGTEARICLGGACLQRSRLLNSRTGRRRYSQLHRLRLGLTPWWSHSHHRGRGRHGPDTRAPQSKL